MKEVLIPYKYVPQYRSPFFSLLRERARPDFNVRISAGFPVGEQALKADSVTDDWYDRHEITTLRCGNRDILWQRGVLAAARSADAVIVEQANALLVNQVLLLTRPGSTAFWGHGYNHQGASGTISERFKRFQLAQPGWWFGYTAATKEYLVRRGVPAHRVTVVQNAVDTSALTPLTRNFADRPRPPSALYIGSLYEDKRLDLLLKVGELLSKSTPNFRLTIAGDGPQRPMIVDAEQRFDWLSYVGRVTSPEQKVRLASDHSIILNPGLVGLVAVESFGLATPVVTLGSARHSPEMTYLESGRNSLVLSGADPEEIARSVADLLSDGKRLINLTQGCIESAGKYTVHAMVDNFLEGLESWFATQGRSRTGRTALRPSGHRR